MWLKSARIATTSRPGQYVMVSCGPDTLLRRPISIHQVDDTRLALLFSVIGRGTQWLSERKSGDEVDLLGPLSNGFTLLPESQRILLVAGGMGIAPLAFLANVAIRQRVKTTLLMGASSAAHLLGLPTDEPSSINIMKTTDDGSLGLKGLVTDMLVEQCRIDQADQIFACGPVPMYQTMSQMPELINKPVQVSLEVRMGCGLGICYGCTIKTRQGLKQVCHDGPIFDLNDIFWDEVIC